MFEFCVEDIINSVEDVSVLQELEDMLPDDMAYLATDKLNKDA